MRGKLLRAVIGEGMGKRKILVAAAILMLAGATAGGVAAAVRAQNEPGNPPYGVGRALTEEEAAAGVTVQAQYFDSFEEALQSIGADPEDFDASAADPGADANPIADPPSDPEPTKHCIAQLEPLKPGEKASEMSEATCFDSFSDAIYAATGGAVRLAATVQPGDVTQEMLAPASQTVISIDYRDPNYQGSTFVWYVNNSYGCNTGWSYANPTMPSGWNDVVSSAHSYGGCNNNPHYEHTYYGGALIFCTCPTMGVMNNQTSSEKWYR
jgi:hypothetical protein